MTGTQMQRTQAIGHLRAALQKIDPGITINDHGGDVLALATPHGWAILALTEDEKDLAPGSCRYLGMTTEMRAAVALAVVEWRDRCQSARKGWVWKNRPRGNADLGVVPHPSEK